MADIKKYIHDKRSSLSDSSITTYASILKSLYRKVFDSDDYDLDKFAHQTEKVLHYLKEIPANRRKTILSALVIITDKQEYRSQMMQDVKAYNQEIHLQEKTETQKENWVSAEDIKKVFDELQKTATLLYKKSSLKPADLQQIQSFIILSLLSGLFIAPRRSKDFCDFKIKNIDKSKDNFLDKNTMNFNSYKTSKAYGLQKIEIPPVLKKILTKWQSVNPTEWLLFDTNMNPLTSVKLNQRLNKIFDGKHIAVNNLRHTYLTDKFGHTLEQKKAVDETMKEMGSSAGMLDTYVKKD